MKPTAVDPAMTRLNSIIRASRVIAKMQAGLGARHSDVLYYQMLALKGRGEVTEQNEAEVVPLMERIVSEFADVNLVYPGNRVYGKLGTLVDSELFAIKNLRVGKVAPIIEGQDVDGQALSCPSIVGKSW